MHSLALHCPYVQVLPGGLTMYQEVYFDMAPFQLTDYVVEFKDIGVVVGSTRSLASPEGLQIPVHDGQMLECVRIQFKRNGLNIGYPIPLPMCMLSLTWPVRRLINAHPAPFATERLDSAAPITPPCSAPPSPLINCRLSRFPRFPPLFFYPFLCTPYCSVPAPPSPMALPHLLWLFSPSPWLVLIVSWCLCALRSFSSTFICDRL